MTEFVDTPGGARIACDRTGEGPAIIHVDGAFQHRAIDEFTAGVGAELADRGFTFVQFDRPGRGETEAPAPFTLADNIGAVRALVDFVGGSATLWGTSSGAAISLAATAAGVEAEKLILWEAPVSAEGNFDAVNDLHGLRQKLAAGDDDAAVRYFMKDFPPEWIEGAVNSPMWPVMTGIAGSLEADTESIAWTQSADRKALFAKIDVPALVLVGDPTLPFFTPAAESLVAALPNATAGTVPATEAHAPDATALLDTILTFMQT